MALFRWSHYGGVSFAAFWTPDAINKSKAWSVKIYGNGAALHKQPDLKGYFYLVRCVKGSVVFASNVVDDGHFFTRNSDVLILLPRLTAPLLKQKGSFPASALMCRCRKTRHHERRCPATTQIACPEKDSGGRMFIVHCTLYIESDIIICTLPRYTF